MENFVENLWKTQNNKKLSTGYPQVIHRLSTGYPQVIHNQLLVYTMVKDKAFQTLYPFPSELSAPVEVDEYPYSYDVFANFHFTFNGFQVSVRQVRKKFLVCCRGFLPAGHEDLRVHYDQGWTTVFSCASLDEAVYHFVNLVCEVVAMSTDVRLAWHDFRLEDYSYVQSYAFR